MPEKSSIRILVCEDESLTALFLQRYLTHIGYAVVGEAKDGEEAIKQALALKPDVILMDVQMPRRDGISATEEIMAACPTAIVMLTAYGESELVQKALDAGASAYLVKPVAEGQLQPTIELARGRFSELQSLGSELKDLRSTLEARKLMERAKGILMQRRNLTEEQAYFQLQKISRDRRQSMKATAEQVIQAAELI